jgi:tetratricopeptide (TPR) repeat protein
MNAHDSLRVAYDLFYQAYELHMVGDLEEAVELYRRSIEAFPTAEAHTFLGWTYSFQGKLDEAIAECKKAIQINPDFGNPYNDIGAYLIEKSQFEEAIPWLLNAARSKYYDNHHYAHYNLARAYIALGQFNRAKEEFENALRISPEYEMAREALSLLKQKIQ